MAPRLFVLFALAAVVGCSSKHEVTSNISDATLAQTNIGNETAEAPQFAAYNPNSVPGMARFKDKSYVLRSAVWKSPQIAVCWETSADGPDRERVRDAIRSSWEANSAVRFFGWGVCAANAQGIRIAVADIGPHTKGLGSQLNAVPQGMVLNFTFQNWSPVCASSETQRRSCVSSIAAHEFGHALGFAHEQNRPDTPGECTEKPQGGNGDLMLTPWDPHSVMNYCNPVYNNDGRLSSLDVQTVRAIYH